MARPWYARVVSRAALCATMVVLVAGTCPLHATGHDEIDPLVGVWESVGPAQVDCATLEPVVGSPTIRTVYTIQHGGTLSEQNTDPVEGPYRSPGFGTWRRVTGRVYVASFRHYGFVDWNLMPTKQLGFLVMARTTLRLARDGASFAESGAFEVYAPDPVTSDLGDPIFGGCFAATAQRLTGDR